MKLLLDANISWRLCAPLSEQFGVCNHVNKTALVPPAKDSEIGKYALENDYVIVTHDFDKAVKQIEKKIIREHLRNSRTNGDAE
jgi:predicted nuclease of predicted toxin-antitoxin system